VYGGCVRYLDSIRYSELFKELAGHEQTFGSSYITRHFRGIAYMNTNQDPKSQLLAAREFRAASDENSSWQSLYGLAVSLVRAGEPALAQPVIKKLEAIQTNTLSNRWYSLALAELLIAVDKPKDALTLLDKLLHLDPRSVKSWELKEAALRKVQKRAEATAAGQTVDDLQRKAGYWNTKEGQSAPLGPLVFID
jgi:predicted Zn-dependent protease